MWNVYRVEFDTAAIKGMLDLPLTIRQRIFSKLDAAKTAPHRHFLRLVGRKERRLRVGDYRIFADIGEGSIRVLAVKHRRNAYR